ncbi:MAG TPA: nucleotidyltransferase family protein [Bacteroidota bacterium]|nr:nucleotidyltransferase family protein [Bacteroidota bacterium]
MIKQRKKSSKKSDFFRVGRGKSRTSTSGVALILLAAGGSARYGNPKQLIPFKGRTLLRHLAEVCVASKAESVHVVLGAYAELLKFQLLGLPLRVIHHTRWSDGLSSSLRVAMKNLPKSAKAVLIVLCDQPHVSTELLNKIIDLHLSKGPQIVACEYGDSLGVPALFEKRFFPELMNIAGDRGAKQIILKHRNKVASIPFPKGMIDINTRRDKAL